jgi:hypothetical protein
MVFTVVDIEPEVKWPSGTKPPCMCQLCPECRQAHLMIVKYGDCAAPNCDNNCPVRIRLRHCLQSKKKEWSTKGVHLGGTRTYNKFKPSDAFLNFIKDHLDFKPAYIRKRYLETFGPENVPPVYTFAYHKGVLKDESVGNLEGNVFEMLKAESFRPDIPEEQPYFFGPSVGCNGDSVGDFLVGITSIKFMRKLPESTGRTVEEHGNIVDGPNLRAQMLHFDATHKVNNCNFPLFIFGFSDAFGRLHPIALFISESEKNEAINTMILFIKTEGLRINRREFMNPRFVMTDGARGLPSVVEKMLPTSTHFMCYFHMIEACRRKCISDDIKKWGEIHSDLQSLHFSLSETEYTTKLNSAMLQWDPAFTSYFLEQWAFGKAFGNWQVFQVPPGFCLTNNPNEVTNKKIKEVFSILPNIPLTKCFENLKQFVYQTSTIDWKPFACTASLDLAELWLLRKLGRESKKFVVEACGGKVKDGNVTYLVGAEGCKCINYRKFSICTHFYKWKCHHGYVPKHLRSLQEKARLKRGRKPKRTPALSKQT